MTAKGSSRLVLLVLPMVLLALIGSIQVVRSSTTIHIRADGSIEGTDKIRRDGDTYTILADITGSIVVERDSIVIDGSKHAIRGPGTQVQDSVGIYLNARIDVTIKNVRIETFFVGIWLYYSSNNQIVGNVFIENKNGILLHESSDNTIKGNEILNSRLIFTGIWLYHSSHSKISQNKVKGNSNGISIHESSNITISTNNITDNFRGISEHGCNSSTICQNYIANNAQGISLTNCMSDTVFGNHLVSNNYGIQLYNSSSNLIFHNSLANNTIQAYTESSISIWHDEYPSGGNYWSDYNGTDAKSGLYQNETGMDGIGDTAYFIDDNNSDSYPLMSPVGLPLTADINRDGKVNILDITLVAQAFGSQPGHSRWNSLCDVDNNQVINIIDITLVARDFGKSF